MTRVPIVVAGAAGLAVLVQAASYYQGDDPLAFWLTCIMAAGLFTGLAEELWRTTRCAQGLRELGQLPPQASAGDLDQLNQTLRAHLWSQINRGFYGADRALFTPYLIGFLVLLGLLGTFLGLFDTLHGAREALTSSTDVNALKSGLTQPMRGLMRSFGTSAAGVGASAALGLAAVFGRRERNRLRLAIEQAATGALAHLTPQQQQQTALDQLVQQAAHLPQATEALHDVSRGIRDLHQAWSDQQASGLESLRQELSLFRQAQAEGLEGNRHHTAETWQRLEQRWTEGQERTLAEWNRLSQTLATSLEPATAALATTADQLRDQWQRAHEQGQAQLATTLDQTTRRMEDQVGQLVNECGKTIEQALGPALERSLTQTIAGTANHLSRVQEVLDDNLRQRQEKEEEAAQRFEAYFDGQAQRLDEWDEKRRHADATSMAEIQKQLAQWTEQWHELNQVQRQQDREAQQAAQKQVDSLAQSVCDWTGQLRQLDTAALTGQRATMVQLTEQLGQWAEHQQRQQQQTQEVFRQQLAMVSETLRQLTEEQRSTSQEAGQAWQNHLERTLQELQQWLEASQTSAATQMAQLEEQHQQQRQQRIQVDQQQAEQWQAMVDQWRQRADTQTEQEERRYQTLVDLAGNLSTRLTESEARLEEWETEATQRLAERHDQARTALDELSRSAQAVTATTKDQLALVEQLVEQGQQRSSNLEEETQQRLQLVLDAFSQSIEEQRNQVTSLEQQLVARHSEQLAALSEKLGRQSREVEGRLAATADLVHEAGTHVNAGGAELSAVAEMFATAVDEYGQASRQWLENLGAVERAVADSGEKAAVEVLDQYLTRTHELFDQQLAFQQELYRQVRFREPKKSAKEKKEDQQHAAL